MTLREEIDTLIAELDVQLEDYKANGIRALDFFSAWRRDALRSLQKALSDAIARSETKQTESEGE